MISVSQIWDNFLLIVVMALIIEIAVSALFSIKYIDELLSNTLTKSVKNFLVLLVAFGLVYNIPQLGIFYKTTIALKKIKIVHWAITTLVLARMANLWHDLFAHLKKKNQGM